MHLLPFIFSPNLQIWISKNGEAKQYLHFFNNSRGYLAPLLLLNLVGDLMKIRLIFFIIIMITLEKGLVWKNVHIQSKHDGGRPINLFAKLISADGIG